MDGSTGATAHERLKAALIAKPDGVIETIARDVGLSPRDVLEALGPEAARMLPAEAFDAIWDRLTGWEEVLLIVHTADVVLEVTGRLPAGTTGQGWFNIHGDGPIGGHLRKDNCTAVALVDRQFHGRRSCSVWFLNGRGEAMVKVFVPRDENRQLKADQLAAFEALLGDFPR